MKRVITREELEAAVQAESTAGGVLKRLGLYSHAVYYRRIKSLIATFGISTEHFRYRQYKRKSKYTAEMLQAAADKSVSVAGVVRALGLAETGNSHHWVKTLLRKSNTNITHFLGARSNSGIRHLPLRRPWGAVLVLGQAHGRRIGAALLKRTLLESGVENKCAVCACVPMWCGRPLVLPVDHINGEYWDNRPENVRFLCPNCHSQTSTFGSKNIGRHIRRVGGMVYTLVREASA